MWEEGFTSPQGRLSGGEPHTKDEQHLNSVRVRAGMWGYAGARLSLITHLKIRSAVVGLMECSCATAGKGGSQLLPGGQWLPGSRPAESARIVSCRCWSRRVADLRFGRRVTPRGATEWAPLSSRPCGARRSAAGSVVGVKALTREGGVQALMMTMIAKHVAPDQVQDLQKAFTSMVPLPDGPPSLLPASPLCKHSHTHTQCTPPHQVTRSSMRASNAASCKPD